MKASDRGWWKLERGETPSRMCLLEKLEETGLVAKPVLKGIITFPEFTPI